MTPRIALCIMTALILGFWALLAWWVAVVGFNPVVVIPITVASFFVLMGIMLGYLYLWKQRA
jgi:hypothetical protein